jgi:hypothetical protein
MTWLAPGFLAWGGAALVILGALHFLARRTPPAEDLPTARFVPARALRITSRGIAPSDALLFLVRALALIAIASAFAGPLVRRARGVVRRVVVVDQSRAIANDLEVRDSARTLVRDGDALVAFDRIARRTTVRALDSLSRRDTRGSLSAALVAATRAAATLSSRADSVELVLVSPLARETIDDATLLARSAWPGRIRVVRVASRAPDTLAHAIDVESADDPLLASVRLRAGRTMGAAVRLRRADPNGADSTWASGAGHVLVHWPAATAHVLSPAWNRRARSDTIGAVVAGETVVVAPFLRAWSFTGGEVARWADGEPAAVEHATGDGCVRDIGIAFDATSDIPLRPEFARLMSELLAPCGGTRDARPSADSIVARIAGGGPLASAESFRAPTDVQTPWTPWLLAAAALLLLMDSVLRRDRRAVAA